MPPLKQRSAAKPLANHLSRSVLNLYGGLATARHSLNLAQNRPPPGSRLLRDSPPLGAVLTPPEDGERARRRSCGRVLPLCRHSSIRGSKRAHCPSLSIVAKRQPHGRHSRISSVSGSLTSVAMPTCLPVRGDLPLLRQATTPLKRKDRFSIYPKGGTKNPAPPPKVGAFPSPDGRCRSGCSR